MEVTHSLFLPSDCHSKLLDQCSLLNIPTRRSRMTLRRYSSKNSHALFSIVTSDSTVNVIMDGQNCISKIEGSLDLDAITHRLKNLWHLRQTAFIEVVLK
jgi:hypothetical protein